jgi:hypothetical protein
MAAPPMPPIGHFCSDAANCIERIAGVSVTKDGFAPCRRIFGAGSLFWIIITDGYMERVMRAFHAIGAAALLIVCAMPLTSRAETPAGVSAVAALPAASCPCPRVHRQTWHPRRHMRSYAWHHRYWTPAPVALAPAPPPPPPWPAYNPPIPSPEDSAYDRVMTQYMLARERSGEYLVEPGYAPDPPLPGLPRFVVTAGGGVFEYDIMADGYVQLAPSDAQRALAFAAPLH